MDTENKTVVIYQSRMNEPRKARKAEEIIIWDLPKKKEKKIVYLSVNNGKSKR